MDLFCWNGRLGRLEVGNIWKMIPHYLMWCLWCERNARTFNGEETFIPTLKFRFIQTLFEWLKGSDLIFSESIPEIVYFQTGLEESSSNPLRSK